MAKFTPDQLAALERRLRQLGDQERRFLEQIEVARAQARQQRVAGELEEAAANMDIVDFLRQEMNALKPHIAKIEAVIYSARRRGRGGDETTDDKPQ
jgi:DNA repair ATPase RecN